MTVSAGADVLVVELDDQVSARLAEQLAEAGFRVGRARSADEARRRLREGGVDLVLLDLEVPGVDGLDLLVEVRDTIDVPVILTSERDSEGDRILGLRLGADDYVGKPFSYAEVVARVAAVLRRRRRQHVPTSAVYGDLEIDERSRQALLRGRDVGLSRREFELLADLAGRRGEAVSREELLREVWKATPECLGMATVTEHVRRVRRKLEGASGEQPWIVTVRGVGYRFDPSPVAEAGPGEPGPASGFGV